MGYVERILQAGEAVTYRGRLHWVTMLPGAALAVISVAVGFAGLGAIGAVRYGLLGVSGLLFLAGGYQALVAWIKRITTEIVVTSQRVIVKTGLAARSSTEISLGKIESVVINQSLLGRMLDYGAVVIRGVGAGLEPVSNLANPLEFRRHINLGG